VLSVLTFSGDYVEPYSTPLGQVVLAVLLTAYVALLVWMKRLAIGKPGVRFLNSTLKGRGR
jgi:hypothetical protein